MNLDQVEFDDVEENGLYTSSRGRISDHIGAKKLGYNLTVLPPGKAQCPFHCHRGEEEMFLILEGEGELRFGDKRYPIRKHDVIACPPGGPEVAPPDHQHRHDHDALLGIVRSCRYRGVRIPRLSKSPHRGRTAERGRPAGDVPRREHGRLLRPRENLRRVLRGRRARRVVRLLQPIDPIGPG
jgi:mannose-6-phosphate isomerase-like protein (cupin superfamily)